MLTAYTQHSNGEVALADLASTPPASCLWVDLLNPDAEERARVETLYQITLPSREQMHEIELSTRFYEEDHACFLNATVITGVETPNPELHHLLFILTKDTLITLRHSDPAPVRRLTERMLKKQVKPHGAADVLLMIIEGLVGRVADTMEAIGKRTEHLSQIIISVLRGEAKKGNDTKLSNVLSEVNLGEDMLSKSYQSLFSLQLLIDFLQQSEARKYAGRKLRDITVVEKDIRALLQHGEYLTQKMEFLLESTLGLINIEQNSIIKMFTVLAMIFMPPTLIASIYGMNFGHMPELDWKLGYPLAIALMVFAAWLPYRFFRKKGWI